MYHEFFGLTELPFELTPNPRYLFLTKQHREALSTLEYGLFSAKGVTALIGEAGTGKTTLLRAALESERCRNVSCVHLMNPTLTRTEFVEILAAKFALSPRASASKAVMLQELDAVLRSRRARGQITALVIDEAQSLSGELLEEIRLLANSETATEKLLPLVLAGQPELRERLNETGLRQLKQRVTLRCEITPFNQQETAAYIAQRIKIAGGDAVRLFTREAVMLIHERSGGIPRTINVMGDNALLTACGLGKARVDSRMVLEVARDFDLNEPRAYGAGFAVFPETEEADTEDEQSHLERPRTAEILNVAEENPATLKADPAPAVADQEPSAGDRALEVSDDGRAMLAPTAAPRFSLFGRR
jgi:type II secretory pathway predicted ATPase ExeA